MIIIFVLREINFNNTIGYNSIIFRLELQVDHSSQLQLYCTYIKAKSICFIKGTVHIGMSFCPRFILSMIK